MFIFFLFERKRERKRTKSGLSAEAEGRALPVRNAVYSRQTSRKKNYIPKGRHSQGQSPRTPLLSFPKTNRNVAIYNYGEKPEKRGIVIARSLRRSNPKIK